MPITFFLFLLMLAAPVLSLIALGWGIRMVFFTSRKRYGYAILVSSFLGGLVALLLLYGLAYLFDAVSAISDVVVLVFFFGGFGVLGCTVAVIGFFAPLFASDNRWAARRTGA